jgi:hypothetical protein
MRAPESYRGDIARALADTKGWLADGWRVVFLTEGHGPGARIAEVLGEAGVAARQDPALDAEITPSVVHVACGSLDTGLIAPALRLAVLTETDLTGQKSAARSGVPYVMLRPTAFMDIWIDQILAKGLREKGVVTVFGDGNTQSNYIAVDDVAEFAVKILARRDVVNEAVEAGGPSNASQNEIATLLEQVRAAGGVAPLEAALGDWRDRLTERGLALLAGAAELRAYLAEHGAADR